MATISNDIIQWVEALKGGTLNHSFFENTCPYGVY